MKRNIATCLILSIVTCGLYTLYWMYAITEDIIIIAKDEWSISGGMTLLLTFLTCGLFLIFWAYKMGRILEKYNGGKDNSILYVMLELLGLNIISLCIIQDQINQCL